MLWLALCLLRLIGSLELLGRARAGCGRLAAYGGRELLIVFVPGLQARCGASEAHRKECAAPV